ncbi:hypothetical protein [Pseudalkalibacillus caeni]|nr:hypothetical protein [Pseudalkalibacillus caeni]
MLTLNLFFVTIQISVKTNRTESERASNNLRVKQLVEETTMKRYDQYIL